MKTSLAILIGLVMLQCVCAQENYAIIGTNKIVFTNDSPQTSHVSKPFVFNSIKLMPYLFPAIFLITGLVHLFCPRFCWWMKWGWRFSGGVEPSGLWLFLERLGGVFIIAGAIYLFVLVATGHPISSKPHAPI